MTNDPLLTTSAADRPSDLTVAGLRLRSPVDSRDPDYWHRWAMRALLVLGGGHFLAGVVFFFAYNWNELSSFSKFALLEAAIIVAVVLALALKLERAAAQGMLIAASVFTGVLLAVIGQVYQTGADAWQLFAAWTLLITPWALGSKNGPHAFFWAVIAMTAITLFSEQRLRALGYVDAEVLAAWLGVMPLLFLAAREIALLSGARWLDGHWMRRTLVFIAIGTLFMLAVGYVFGEKHQLPGLRLFILACLCLAFIYGKLLPDFPVTAILTGFVALFGMAVGGRMLLEMIDTDFSAGTLVLALFLLGGWCALLTAGTVKFLRRLYASLGKESDNAW